MEEEPVQSGRSVDDLLRHPNWMVREYAVQTFRLTRDQIDLALKDRDVIKKIVISRTPLTSAQIESLLADASQEVRIAVALYQELTPEQLMLARKGVQS